MQSLQALLLILIVVLHVQAQDQHGFISLDCGLPDDEESPYTEPATRLNFSSDDGFINTGKTGKIRTGFWYSNLKPYQTLRYFPEGVRNCYELNVTKNTNYLVRAWFIYGNYDGLDSFPKFDVYVGPNKWTTIESLFSGGKKAEMIHMPKTNTLKLCLVRTGNGSPIISALELRPLRNGTYIADSGSLKLFDRRYSSNSIGGYIRYYDDSRDRYWETEWISNMGVNWTEINTTLSINTSNIFDPPRAALANAAIPTNPNAPLFINFSLPVNDDQVYMYMHFAEIQTNGTREFDILWNETNLQRAFSPRMLRVDTVVNAKPFSCGTFGSCSVKLTKTRRSALPPLLNAYEIFTVSQFPLSETYGDDVAAVKIIEETYGLNRIDWQGDPCLPRQLLWDGLNCSYADVSTPPRIVSLNLSSNGLKGTIASSIQDLTQLQMLDLSNNNLIGEVPEFLANMTSLKVLNLSRNDLRGTVPQALNDRKQKGLELILDGNPKLCNSTSCPENDKKKFMVPVVASVASVAALAAVLLLIYIYRRKKASRAKAKDRSSNPSERKKRFTYSEVMEMTDNFQRVLGKGGFGVVYHGFLYGVGQVAVKILTESSSESHKQFKAEVKLLLRVHHTNLVSLAGYCEEGNHLALIYENMPNGDLKQLLSGRRGGSFVLSWASFQISDTL